MMMTKPKIATTMTSNSSTSSYNKINPLAVAQKYQNKVKAIWHGKMGTRYHFFVEYYALQPTSIMIVPNDNDNLPVPLQQQQPPPGDENNGKALTTAMTATMTTM